MIIEYKSMNDVPSDIKLHILELNIKFIKRQLRGNIFMNYPKYPETYNNITVKKKNGSFIVYGNLDNLNITDNNTTELKLQRCTNCYIDENGLVLKNRWGDEDCIGA